MYNKAFYTTSFPKGYYVNELEMDELTITHLSNEELALVKTEAKQ